ncbi:MAG TPA: hypothetical protein VK391_02190 [Allosphingosinicella sp.]|nr:hypothetical protein [Allosphingosinicella sp.]
MTQPLICSTTAPWGNHVSLRDNICPRCGWTAPGPGAPDAISDGGLEPRGDSGTTISQS